MKRLVFLAPLLLFSPPSPNLDAQNATPADSAHFVINQGNHPVGRSDFSIQPVKQGSIAIPAAYNVTSHGTLTLPRTTYSFSASGTLDQNLAILSEDLNGIVNGSAVNFAVTTTGGNLVITISANGQHYSNSLTRSGQTAFLPDFDLAGYELLLNMAALHPGASLLALVPKQTGILSPATLAPQSDAQATLNGKALTVHHTSLTISSVTSELYFSTANHLLEVDIPGQTFAVVHEGFQLQQPPPPPPETQQQPGANNAPTAQPQ